MRGLVKFSIFPILLYGAGLVWFMNSLPGPAGAEKTDGIVVLTGGEGRVARGFELIERGAADRLLISGVASVVRPQELAARYDVPMETIRCCVDLGRAATDTRTNGQEIAEWVQRRRLRSIRVVTNDWHMPRARKEIGWRLGSTTRIVPDAVHSERTFKQLFVEYNKYLISPFGEELGLE
ncbi:MAG: YdcF family protein [Allosphingosinicella sp.]|uniref:YdcF family protein n=1 Tax=Allosphingosinicella sp. TaxID=2823234 RepID=UPI003952EBB2